MALFKLVHLLAVLCWVGGMFFAYIVLRPAALEALEVPQRLGLWNAVLRRFFNWVWVALGVLLTSGLYMIYLYGGIGHTPFYVHIMLSLGISMMVIYGYVFFFCYVPLGLHVAKQRWKEGGEQLARIRRLIALNLFLGLLTVCAVKIGAAIAA